MIFRRKPRCSSVTVSIRVEVEDGEADSLVAELIVNDRLLPAFDHGPLDLEQLEQSISSAGKFYIWTCECGEPGCAGRYKGVAVNHEQDQVHWNDDDMNEKYTFQTDELRMAVAQVKQEGAAILTKQPEIETTPLSNRKHFVIRGEQSDALNPGSGRLLG